MAFPMSAAAASPAIYEVPTGYAAVAPWVMKMLIDKETRTIRDVVERPLQGLLEAIRKGNVWMLSDFYLEENELVRVYLNRDSRFWRRDKDDEVYGVDASYDFPIFMPQDAVRGTEVFWNPAWYRDNPTCALRWVGINAQYIKDSPHRGKMDWFKMLAYSPDFKVAVYSTCRLDTDRNLISISEPRKGEQSFDIARFDYTNKRFFMEYRVYVPPLRSFPTQSTRVHLDKVNAIITHM
jgi:hypothetical protein